MDDGIPSSVGDISSAINQDSTTRKEMAAQALEVRDRAHREFYVRRYGSL